MALILQDDHLTAGAWAACACAEKKYSLTIACIDHLTRRDLFLWSLRIYDTKETLN